MNIFNFRKSELFDFYIVFYIVESYFPLLKRMHLLLLIMMITELHGRHYAESPICDISFESYMDTVRPILLLLSLFFSSRESWSWSHICYDLEAQFHWT